MMSSTTYDLRTLLPKTHCPFVWKTLQLTDSRWKSKKDYDLSVDLSLEKALAVLSEEMSFCDKLDLASKTSRLLDSKFEPEIYFKESGYVQLELINKIQSLVKEIPAPFLNWCSDKKLGAKDFRIFLNDYCQADQDFFLKIANLDATKSTGLQLIELYYDLKAQNKINLDEILTFKKPEKLFSFLKKKRFNSTLYRDDELENALSKIQLAQGIKASLKRVGDKRTIRLELEADSPDQLKYKLEKCLSKNESFALAWKSRLKS